jgi:hypothetical protein
MSYSQYLIWIQARSLQTEKKAIIFVILSIEEVMDIWSC